MPIESILGLYNEKSFIITGIVFYQQYVQSVDLPMPAKPRFRSVLETASYQNHSFAEIIS